MDGSAETLYWRESVDRRGLLAVSLLKAADLKTAERREAGWVAA